jgi:hypothetical protein
MVNPGHPKSSPNKRVETTWLEAIKIGTDPSKYIRLIFYIYGDLQTLTGR